MEEFETKPKHAKNKQTFKYVITYLDLLDNECQMVSEKIYTNPDKARRCGIGRMNELKHQKIGKRFKCRLRQEVIPSNILNRDLAMSQLKDGEIYVEKWKIIRFNKKYSIEEVLSKYSETDEKIDFDGDFIPMGSQRYENFKINGTTCKVCKLKGQYFYKERFAGNDTYHFNLYGVNENGEEILFTKDHIVAKSRGGKNHITNYQTMCQCCNKQKGVMDNEKYMKLKGVVNM